MKQPIIYVEDTTIEDKVVSIIFTLFIILTIIVFFSRFLVQEESQPINITQVQSDLITNKASLPEGLANQTLLTNGNDFLNPKNLTLNTLEQLSSLEECPEGECAIDLGTGVKRCPQNNNTRIVYNRAFEGCSAKFFCSCEQLPYAVLSSGETDTFGVCETDVECRCSADIVCPKYVVSSFNLNNGSSFSGLRKDLNYYFDQTTLDDDKVVGYDSIVIPEGSTNVQFCIINPSYSDRIAGGCQFVNGDNDILGCLNSQDFYNISIDSFDTKIKSEFPLGYQDSPGSNGLYQTIPYQSSLNIVSSEKPEKGYVKYTTSEGKLQIMGYNSNDINSKTINNNNISTVTNLYTTTYDPTVAEDVALSDNLGTSTEISGQGDLSNILEFMKIIYTGCSDVSGVFISNNNMLLCTQTSNQLCKQGLFSYRVDNKSASQFCQFTPTLKDYIDQDGDFSKLPTKDSAPLDDPQYYTLSCVTGPGCNGNYSQSFCQDGDCTQAITEYQSRFQDFDTSAMNGIWLIKNTITPEAGIISFTYSNSTGIILKNNGLLVIEPGDYFSTVKGTYQKLLLDSVTVIEDSTFILGSVDNLEVGYNVYANGYKGVILSINTSENKIVVTKITSVVTTIPAYSLIDFFKPVNVTEDGQKFGKLIVRSDGTIFPTTLSGNGTTPTKFISTPSTIFIFKQFGFNGSNYNTKFVFTTTTSNAIYRQYDAQSQWYYWLNTIKSVVNDGDLLMAPLSSNVVPLSIFLKESNKTITRGNINAVVFSSPEADFKQDLSFYYPVWNQSRNSQVCIKCKPSLNTYLKINDKSNVVSAVIQFSGRDFGQYMYYPNLTQVKDNNYFEITTPKTSSYIFNFLTSISQDENSSTKRIILDSINSNLPFSSDVADDYYTTHPYYILDSNNVIKREILLVNSDVFPVIGKAPETIQLYKIQLDAGMTEVNVLPDEWTSFYYDDIELIPNSTVQFNLSKSNNNYINHTRQDDSNWFSGKSYFYDRMQLVVQGQVRITNVQLINGKQVIYTDSVSSNTIPNVRNTNNNPTVLQIYSTLDTLELGFDNRLLGKQTVIVDSINDQRITNLSFPITTTSTVSIDALPRIVFTKYRNLL